MQTWAPQPKKYQKRGNGAALQAFKTKNSAKDSCQTQNIRLNRHLIKLNVVYLVFCVYLLVSTIQYIYSSAKLQIHYNMKAILDYKLNKSDDLIDD